MQILASLYAFKLVINIIANFRYAFSWQFMKSSISWDMFGKILVFSFEINDVLPSIVSLRWFTMLLNQLPPTTQTKSQHKNIKSNACSSSNKNTTHISSSIILQYIFCTTHCSSDIVIQSPRCISISEWYHQAYQHETTTYWTKTQCIAPEWNIFHMLIGHDKMRNCIPYIFKRKLRKFWTFSSISKY